MERDDSKILTCSPEAYIASIHEGKLSDYILTGIHTCSPSYNECFNSFVDKARKLNAEAVTNFQESNNNVVAMHGTALIPRKIANSGVERFLAEALPVNTLKFGTTS